MSEQLGTCENADPDVGLHRKSVICKNWQPVTVPAAPVPQSGGETLLVSGPLELALEVSNDEQGPPTRLTTWQQAANRYYRVRVVGAIPPLWTDTLAAPTPDRGAGVPVIMVSSAKHPSDAGRYQHQSGCNWPLSECLCVQATVTDEACAKCLRLPCICPPSDTVAVSPDRGEGVASFDSWWKQKGYKHMPGAGQPPEHALTPSAERGEEDRMDLTKPITVEDFNKQIGVGSTTFSPNQKVFTHPSQIPPDSRWQKIADLIAQWKVERDAKCDNCKKGLDLGAHGCHLDGGEVDGEYESYSVGNCKAWPLSRRIQQIEEAVRS